MRFPKLIKQEYYSTSPVAHGVWIQRLSFHINKRLRESILQNNNIKDVLETYKTYLQRQKNIKLFYMLAVNAKKKPDEQKSKEDINKNFDDINTAFSEYLLSACKALYILDVPKGIKKIKRRVERRKKELLKIFRRLPVEICFKIFKYTFTY